VDITAQSGRKGLQGNRYGEITMDKINFAFDLQANTYPGRGIALGRSADGKYAVTVYFIMGRSENSRNRIFVTEGEGIRTEAFDPKKLSDPSLIIYSPVRCFENKLIVTNGDQTDTIYDYLAEGKSFEDALETRLFEPDVPNYTPRISGLISFENGDFSYRLSILKSDEGRPESCLRYTYSYPMPMAGEARFIHTYRCDGSPIPSFEGEPKRVSLEGGIDELSESLWSALNEDNKVSLYVRFTELKTLKYETRIINKNR
jgi:hypothetical protein